MPAAAWLSACKPNVSIAEFGLQANGMAMDTPECNAFQWAVSNGASLQEIVVGWRGSNQSLTTGGDLEPGPRAEFCRSRGVNLGRAVSVVNGSSSDDEVGFLHSSTKRQKAVPAASTSEHHRKRRTADRRHADRRHADRRHPACSTSE